jgi:hypothetical protein
MLAGWLWAGLAVQHPEAGLLAGIVGLGEPFWSMALFLDAPPPVGDRLGMTIPGHHLKLSERHVTIPLRLERADGAHYWPQAATWSLETVLATLHSLRRPNQNDAAPI